MKTRPTAQISGADEHDYARLLTAFARHGDGLRVPEIAVATGLREERVEALLVLALAHEDLVPGRLPEHGWHRALHAPKLGETIDVVYARRLSIEAIVVAWHPGCGGGERGMFVAVSSRGVHRGNDVLDLTGRPVWRETFGAPMGALVSTIAMAEQIAAARVRCERETA